MLFKDLNEEHGINWLKNTIKENALQILIEEILEIESQILFLNTVINQFEENIDEIISNLETEEDIKQWEDIKSSIVKSINQESTEREMLTKEMMKKKEQMNHIIMNNITPLR